MARDELAGAGGRRSRAGPTGQLTAQEQKVVKLAAQGRSNAEIANSLFLSARTVGHHLSRSHAKLGNASRNEPPAALSGSAPPPA
jgi:DNA-binding CsgD family transcriptional regulator